MLLQSPQTPSTEQIEEGPLFGEAVGSEGGAQTFLSEISEKDIEVLRQREEALLQIEVSTLTFSSASYMFYLFFLSKRSHSCAVHPLTRAVTVQNRLCL